MIHFWAVESMVTMMFCIFQAHVVVVFLFVFVVSFCFLCF